MKIQKAKTQYSVAELFCGCGGFSHGFWRTGRFQTVLGNDIKKFALQTFKANHSHGGKEPAIIEKDIRTVSDVEIINLLKSKGITELDCLLGGPPCQGFSQMRRTEGRRGSKIVRFGGYNKLDQDPRNDLVLRFLEIAAALNPKVIVIENVPQFLSHYYDGKPGGIARQVEEVLREAGYAHVHCDILNAADYGVPQLRERAFIIASRLGPILTGKPDFVFRKQRVAVFVDGCFWHGCPKHGTKPASNRAFWRKKFAANKARDQRVSRELRRQGWCILRIWEHSLKNSCRVARQIQTLLLASEKHCAHSVCPFTVFTRRRFSGKGFLYHCRRRQNIRNHA